MHRRPEPYTITPTDCAPQELIDALIEHSARQTRRRARARARQIIRAHVRMMDDDLQDLIEAYEEDR